MASVMLRDLGISGRLLLGRRRAEDVGAKVIACNLAGRGTLDIGTSFGGNPSSILPASDRWGSNTKSRSQCVLGFKNLDRAIEGRFLLHGRVGIHG